MSPNLYLMISFGSLLLLVAGLVAGYFLGKSSGASSSNAHFKEALGLWRSAVNKIDESTRRSVVQLGSVRDRLTDLNQSMNDPLLAAPIDDLTDQLLSLERAIQNLKSFSKSFPNTAVKEDQKQTSPHEVSTTPTNRRQQVQQSTSPTRSFDDFVSEIKNRVERDTPLRNVLDYVYETLPTFIPCQRMGYAEIDYDADRVTALWYRSQTSGKLTSGYSAPLSSSSLRFLTDKGRPRVLNNLPEYLRRHPGSKSTRLIVNEGYRSSLTLPVVANDLTVAFLFISNVEVDSFNEDSVELARQVVAQLGHSIHLPTKRRPSKPALT